MSSDSRSLPIRTNPLGDAGGDGGNCSMKILGLVIIFAFSIRVWVNGIQEYVELEASHREWTQTNATVVGVNATLRAYFQESTRRYFCPLVYYETTAGENITTIGHSDCSQSLNDTLELVGNTIQVRYDPYNPEEFIELDAYESEMTWLTLIIASGISLNLFFGVVLIRTICMTTPNRTTDEGKEVTGLEQKEREELIRSKFHFQEVSSDKGNMDIANMNSTQEKKICDNKEEDEEKVDKPSESTSEKNVCENKEEDLEKVDKASEIDEELGDSCSSGPAQQGGVCSSSGTPSMMLPSQEKKVDKPSEVMDEELGDSCSSGPAQQGGVCSSYGTPSMMLPSLASTFALNSSLLSSWRRPAGVTTECVICLEEYQPGEIICTAKTAECNHVFHEKCVTSWLLANHDDCPLCRVNLLTG